MGILSSILAGGASKLISSIGGIVDEFHLSGEEKNDFTAKMEELLQQRDSEIEETIRIEMTSKMEIIKAEMDSGDNYTKRARPTVVYVGLGLIVWNYAVVPTLAMVPVVLPTEFWVAWGGIVSTWVVGRSVEKRGIRSPLVSKITGNKLLDL